MPQLPFEEHERDCRLGLDRSDSDRADPEHSWQQTTQPSGTTSGSTTRRPCRCICSIRSSSTARDQHVILSLPSGNRSDATCTNSESCQFTSSFSKSIHSTAPTLQLTISRNRSKCIRGVGLSTTFTCCSATPLPGGRWCPRGQFTPWTCPHHLVPHPFTVVRRATSTADRPRISWKSVW